MASPFAVKQRGTERNSGENAKKSWLRVGEVNMPEKEKKKSESERGRGWLSRRALSLGVWVCSPTPRQDVWGPRAIRFQAGPRLNSPAFEHPEGLSPTLLSSAPCSTSCFGVVGAASRKTEEWQ